MLRERKRGQVLNLATYENNGKFSIIKNIAAALGIGAVLAVILVLSFDYPKPDSAVELTGILDGLYQPPSDDAVRTFFLVKLDDGTIAQVKVSSNILFQKGKKVKIIQQKTRILNRKVYDFISYLEENKNED